MLIKDLVQKYLFLLVIICVIIFGGMQIGISYNVNLIQEINSVLRSITIIVFIFIYFLLSIFKILTNKTYSFIHLFLISISLLLHNIFNVSPYLKLFFFVASMIVFGLNIFWAIKNKNDKNLK